LPRATGFIGADMAVGETKEWRLDAKPTGARHQVTEHVVAFGRSGPAPRLQLDGCATDVGGALNRNLSE
jgi:hypothetical protein